MPDNEDLYEILQVHPLALPEVIQAAYRRLAQLYHPDANPALESTELMSRLNRAYEVLSDPEKRAAYDLERNLPAASPDAAPAQTEEPETRPVRRSRSQAPDYFTIGSTKAQVSRVQGAPDSTYSDDMHEGERWFYPTGSEGRGNIVVFDRRGRVEGWFSSGGLKVKLEPGPSSTTAHLFTIGSHKDDLARLQGTPDSIIVPSRYTRAEIQRQRQDARESRTLMREVAKTLGERYEPEPEVNDSFDYDADRETWHYPGGEVEFSVATGRVTGWWDDGGAFKVERKPEVLDRGWDGSDFFTLGSTMAEVRKAQGRPTSTIPLNNERWRYSDILEYVEFDCQSKRVRSWNNYYGNLKTKVLPGPFASQEPEFSLGSHRDHVVQLQGTPRSIKISQHFDDEVWEYSGGRVVFSSSTNRVIGWENREGLLRV